MDLVDMSANTTIKQTITNNEKVETHEKKKKKKKRKIYENKCNCLVNNKICKKKLSFSQVITNKCKCGLVFCNLHKGSENLECTFDYKKIYICNNMDISRKMIKI